MYVVVMSGNESLSRRQFLKNTFVSGAGISVLKGADMRSIGNLEYDKGNEVPYLAFLRGGRRGREPVYEKLPKDEWERKFSVEVARDNIESLLKENYEEESFTVLSSVMEQSPTGYGVTVRSDNLDSDFLPYSLSVHEETQHGDMDIDDIPVVLEQEAELNRLSCFNNDYQWPDSPGVPGGALVDDIDGEAWDYGTITAPFTRAGQFGWITAGHVVEDASGVRHGQTSGNRDYIGDVQTRYVSDYRDYAFVTPNSSENVAPKISNSEGTGYEYDVFGDIITDSALKAHKGDSNWLTQQGVSTCRGEGTITNVGAEHVETDHMVSGGDSGGPIFRVDTDDNVKIAGSLNGELDDGTAVFTTAETIENYLDGQFGLVV